MKKIFILFLVFAAISPLVVTATTYYWNTSSGNWNTASNWATGGFGGTTSMVVPGSSDSVCIGNLTNNATITLTGNDTVGYLTLEGSGQLFINGSSYSLVVSANMHITNTGTTGGGSATIVMGGSSLHRIYGTAIENEGKLPNITLNGSGAVYLSGYITMGGSTTLNSSGYTGTFHPGSGSVGSSGFSDIVFYYNNTITGNISLDNAEFQGNSGTFTINNTITLSNDLTISLYNPCVLNTGSIIMSGNLYDSNTHSASGGSATIIMTAGSSTTYSSTTGPLCNLVIATGTVSPISHAISLSALSLKISGGTFNAPWHTLSIGGSYSAADTIFNQTGGTFNNDSGTVLISITGHVTAAYTINVQPSTQFHNLSLAVYPYGSVAPYFTTPSSDTVQATDSLTHAGGILNGNYKAKNLVIGSSANSGTGQIIMDGASGRYTCGTSGYTCFVNVRKLSGDSLSPASGTTGLGVTGLTISSGIFIAPIHNLTIEGWLSASTAIFKHSGGTFSHNNGTVVVNIVSYTNSVYTMSVLPSTLFHNLSLSSSPYGNAAPYLTPATGDTVKANDSIIHNQGALYGTWEGKNLVVGSSASGGPGQIILHGTSGKYTCGSSGYTCTIDVSKQTGDSLSAASGTTTLGVSGILIDSGAFIAPATLTIEGIPTATATIFNHTGGTFSHNNGTIYVNVSAAANGAFSFGVLPSTLFYNVSLGIGPQGSYSPYLTTVSGDTVKVANKFTKRAGTVNGIWMVYDSALVSTSIAGTAELLFSGSGSKQLLAASGATLYKLTMGKASGTLTLNSPVTLTNNLNLSKGIITSTSTNVLILSNGATVTGGNDSSYVSGPMEKIGNAAFKFPLGGGSHYHAVAISAPSSTSDAYTAQYFNSKNSNAGLDGVLTFVDSCEYWNLVHTTGTSTVHDTLFWNNPCFHIPSLSYLKIGYLNGTTWTTAGTCTSSGTTTKGAIASPLGTVGYLTVAKDNQLINIASSNTAICTGASVSLGSEATVTGGTSALTYAWSPATGLSSTTASNPTASPTTTTTYTLIVTDAITESSSATAVVTVNPLPTNNSGSNLAICNGSSTIIGAIGTSGHTYSWSPSTGLSASTTSNPAATSTTTTTYMLTETITSTGCSVANSVVVTVNPLPGNNVGPNQVTCRGSSATIGASSTTGDSYEWSPSTGLNNTSVSDPIASPATTTTYTLTETISATGCSVSNSVTITIDPNLIASAGRDTILCVSGNTNLGSSPTAAGGTSPYSYNWTPSQGLNNSNISNPVFSYSHSNTYVVTISDSIGCSVKDTINIVKLEDLLNNLNAYGILAGNNIISLDSNFVYGNIGAGDSIKGIIRTRDTTNINVGSYVSAETDLINLTNTLEKLSGHSIGGNLNGLSLQSGVYIVSGNGTLSDSITLNGDSCSYFVFYTSDSLLFKRGSFVKLLGVPFNNIIFYAAAGIVGANSIDLKGMIISSGNIYFDSVLCPISMFSLKNIIIGPIGKILAPQSDRPQPWVSVCLKQNGLIDITPCGGEVEVTFSFSGVSESPISIELPAGIMYDINQPDPSTNEITVTHDNNTYSTVTLTFNSTLNDQISFLATVNDCDLIGVDTELVRNITGAPDIGFWECDATGTDISSSNPYSVTFESGELHFVSYPNQYPIYNPSSNPISSDYQNSYSQQISTAVGNQVYRYYALQAVSKGIVAGFDVSASIDPNIYITDVEIYNPNSSAFVPAPNLSHLNAEDYIAGKPDWCNYSPADNLNTQYTFSTDDLSAYAISASTTSWSPTRNSYLNGDPTGSNKGDYILIRETLYLETPCGISPYYKSTYTITQHCGQNRCSNGKPLQVVHDLYMVGEASASSYDGDNHPLVSISSQITMCSGNTFNLDIEFENGNEYNDPSYYGNGNRKISFIRIPFNEQYFSLPQSIIIKQGTNQVEIGNSNFFNNGNHLVWDNATSSEYIQISSDDFHPDNGGNWDISTLINSANSGYTGQNGDPYDVFLMSQTSATPNYFTLSLQGIEFYCQGYPYHTTTNPNLGAYGTADNELQSSQFPASADIDPITQDYSLTGNYNYYSSENTSYYGVGNGVIELKDICDYCSTGTDETGTTGNTYTQAIHLNYTNSFDGSTNGCIDNSPPDLYPNQLANLSFTYQETDLAQSDPLKITDISSKAPAPVFNCASRYYAIAELPYNLELPLSMGYYNVTVTCNGAPISGSDGGLNTLIFASLAQKQGDPNIYYIDYGAITNYLGTDFNSPNVTINLGVGITNCNGSSSSGWGPQTVNVEFRARCSNCDNGQALDNISCYRSLGSCQASVINHCGSTCATNAGVLPTAVSMDHNFVFNRSTYGWASSNDYATCEPEYSYDDALNKGFNPGVVLENDHIKCIAGGTLEDLHYYTSTPPYQDFTVTFQIKTGLPGDSYPIFNLQNCIFTFRIPNYNSGLPFTVTFLNPVVSNVDASTVKGFFGTGNVTIVTIPLGTFIDNQPTTLLYSVLSGNSNDEASVSFEGDFLVKDISNSLAPQTYIDQGVTAQFTEQPTESNLLPQGTDTWPCDNATATMVYIKLNPVLVLNEVVGPEAQSFTTNNPPSTFTLPDISQCDLRYVFLVDIQGYPTGNSYFTSGEYRPFYRWPASNNPGPEISFPREDGYYYTFDDANSFSFNQTGPTSWAQSAITSTDEGMGVYAMPDLGTFLNALSFSNYNQQGFVISFNRTCMGDLPYVPVYPQLTFTDFNIQDWAYQIPDESENVSDLPTGTYTVTVTCPNGSPVSQTFNITSNNLVLNFQVYNAVCSQANGSIAVSTSNGVSPYTYSWSAGTTNATGDIAYGLTAGTYTVTVTDSKGCNGTATETVNAVGGPPVTSLIENGTSCTGENILLTVSGGTVPFTYSWSDGNTAQNREGLPANTYSVSVTDANGCSTSISGLIVTPQGSYVTLSAVSSTCNQSNGAVFPNITGGTPPYTYIWSNGASTPYLSEISASTYTVTITDLNFCTSSASATVSNTSLSLSNSSDISTASCSATGGIALNISGGDEPYTYSWSTTTTGTPISCANNTPYFWSGYSAIDDYTSSKHQFGIFNNFEPVSLSSPTITYNGNSANVTLTFSPDPDKNQVNDFYFYVIAPNSYTIKNFSVSNYTSQNLFNGNTIYEMKPMTTDIIATFEVDFPNTDCGENITVNYGCGCNELDFGICNTAVQQLEPGVSNNACENYKNYISPCFSKSENILINPTNAPQVNYYYNLNPDTISRLSNCRFVKYEILMIPRNIGDEIINPIAYVEPIGDLSFAGNSMYYDSYIHLHQNQIDAQGNYLGTTDNYYGAAFNPANISPILSPGPDFLNYLEWNSATILGLNQLILYNQEDKNSIDYADYIEFDLYFQPCTELVTKAAEIAVVASSACSSGGSAEISSDNYFPNGLNTSGQSSSGTLDIANLAGYCTTQNCDFQFSATAGSASGCGQCDGTTTINITPSGLGFAPFTYSWSDGSTAIKVGQTSTTSALLTSLCSNTTYTVTVTDNTGASSTTSFTELPTNLTITIAGQTPICGYGGTGTIDFNLSTSTSPYNFSWSGQENGNEDNTLNTSISGLEDGNYTITVTDANGCSGTATATINTPPTLTQNVSLPCSQGQGSTNGTFSLTIDGTGPFTYWWEPPGTSATSITITSPDTYDVTVTDVNECTATTSLAVSSNPIIIGNSPTITQPDCNSADGSILITVTGGNTPYTYSWSNGNTTNNPGGLSLGVYGVTVTDANGCTVSGQYSLETNIPNASLSGTNATCDVSNGYINIVATTGGTPPYTYSWSPGGSTALSITDLSTGIYTVKVTDQNRCTSNSSLTIYNSNSLPAQVCTPYPTNCGQSNGSIIISFNGGVSPYTYSWSGVGSGTGTSSAAYATIPNLNSGAYTITVSDVNLCSGTESVSISPNTGSTAPTLTTATTNADCGGGSNGTATVSANGGQSPYTYSWNSGATTATANSLSGGTSYYVTVTDWNLCTVSAQVTISNNSAPPTPVFTSSSPTTVCSNSTGNVYTVQSGNYTYTWSITGGTINSGGGPSDNSATVTWGSINGSISVQFTENSCQSVITTLNVAVNVSPYNLTLIGIPTTCGHNDGKIEAVFKGGTGPFTYSWTGPSGFTSQYQNIQGLTTGDYYFTVTDFNSCSFAEGPVTLSNSNTLYVSIDGNNSVCNGNTETIAAGVSNGIPDYTYSWSDGTTNYYLTTPPIISNTEYSVTITDATGCSGSNTLTISVDPSMTLTFTPTTPSCGNADGALSVAVSGGTSPYTYSWNTGASTSSASGLYQGDYTVTVTDEIGCTSALSYRLDASCCEGDAALLTFNSDITCGTLCTALNTYFTTIYPHGHADCGTDPIVISFDAGYEQLISINGNLYMDVCDLELDNCVIQFANGGGINTNGNSLTLNNTTIDACTGMWGGITDDGAGSSAAIIKVQSPTTGEAPSTLRHAEDAISVTNNTQLYISNSNFLDDYIGLDIENYTSSGSTVSIYGNTFDIDYETIANSNDFGAFNGVTHTYVIPYADIYINNCNTTITVGDPSQAVNNFHNFVFGVHSSTSSIDVGNNDFTHYFASTLDNGATYTDYTFSPYHCISTGSTICVDPGATFDYSGGTLCAVYAIGSNTKVFTCWVGPGSIYTPNQTNANELNFFAYGHRGVFVTKNMHAGITYNVFDHMTDAGVEVYENDWVPIVAGQKIIIMHHNNLTNVINGFKVGNYKNIVGIGIYNNSIDGGTLPTGSIGISIQTPGLKPGGNSSIYNNSIASMNTGIALNRSENMSVYNNLIIYEPDHNGISYRYGIRAYNVWGLNIYDHNDASHDIQANTTAAHIYGHSEAINVENCNNFTLCNNSVNVSDNGITIAGTSAPIYNGPISVTCNSMDQDNNGFALLGKSTVGPQRASRVVSNNSWPDASTWYTRSRYATYAPSSNNQASLTKFYVLNDAIHNPANNSGGITFQTETGTIDCPCSSPFPGDNFEGRTENDIYVPMSPSIALYESIVLGDTSYSDAELYIAKQSVYRALINEDAELLDSSEILRNFVDSTAGNNMGALQAVNDTLLNALNDSAPTFYYFASPYVEGGMDSIALPSPHVSISASINSSITPINDVETAQQTVNNIYLNTILSGTDTLTSSQRSTIWAIAQACPSQKGNCVYQARAILSALLDSLIDYPDTCTSIPSGARREIGGRTSTLLLYPNPADNVVNIEFRNYSSQNTGTRLQIIDALGEIIRDMLLPDNAGMVTINTTRFANGIYIVRWQDGNGKTHFNKFIVDHY